MLTFVALLSLASTPALARPKTAPAPIAAPAEPAPPTVDPALAADIRELLKATGAGAVAVQSLNTMVEQMRAVRPDIPAGFWTAFQAEVDPDSLIELLVPVYAAHFTREEVQALLAFYASPVGKRFVEETPGLMAEASAVGQKWGTDVASRVVQKMLLEGDGVGPAGGVDGGIQGGVVPPAAGN